MQETGTDLSHLSNISAQSVVSGRSVHVNQGRYSEEPTGNLPIGSNTPPLTPQQFQAAGISVMTLVAVAWLVREFRLLIRDIRS
jgi:hypothetical protein